MIYKGITKSRSLAVKIGIVITCLIMLYVEIRIKKYIYIPIVVFVALVAFFEKEHLVSEDGVDIKYTLLGISSHYYWKWEEITTLHIDDKKAAPNLMLHIGKDVVTRTFIMDEKTCMKVIALARKMNPNIYIHSGK